MSRQAPIAVRLPRAFALGGYPLARVLNRHAITGDVRLGFTMTPRETRFAKRLLEAHTNLWVYRVHQRRFAGDFAVVDMSRPAWSDRRLLVLDLKLGAPVKLGRGSAGVQLLRVPALSEMLEMDQVTRRHPILATGDGTALADWIGNRRYPRS